MGSLGSENPSLDVVLGYDPWKFLRLVNPQRDFAYLTFGWFFYEAVLCTSILIQARKKWRSKVFQALTLCLLSHLGGTVLGITIYSSSPEVANDLLVGPTEYAVWTICPITLVVTKWCYFYAMMAIVMSVFRDGYKAYRVIAYLVTALAMAASLCLTISIAHFYRLTYGQYVLYMETRNIGAMLSRIPNVILPFRPFVVKSQEVERFTMVSFTLLTKIPFLLKLFSAVNVPVRQAIKTMVTTKSTQRIVSSIIWTVVEVCLISNVGRGPLTFAVTAFSMMFQITALAMLAFHDSAAIIREHSLASRPGSTVKPRSMITSAHGGGSGVDTPRTR